MLSYVQSALLIGLSIGCALVLVNILNRLWPIQSRKIVNDVTGWQLGVLGTTYGVILGFMLYTVWGGFRAAQIDANLEATSMLNVYRLAAGLPSPQGEEIRDLARRYESVVVEVEWPAMQHQQDEHAAALVLSQMWDALAHAKADTPLTANSIDHIQYAMSALSEHRSMREQQSTNRVPFLLWVLLLLGAIATIVSSCVLGNDKKWLHYCQVAALTFVVITTLVAVADLARPYDGAVAVEPSAFTHALQLMRAK
ncbi:MAG TPA: hypothetical protein VGG95_13140 [Edaphobacter sp.]|jgi:hypothetical protein